MRLHVLLFSHSCCTTNDGLLQKLPSATLPLQWVASFPPPSPTLFCFFSLMVAWRVLCDVILPHRFSSIWHDACQRVSSGPMLFHDCLPHSDLARGILTGIISMLCALGETERVAYRRRRCIDGGSAYHNALQYRTPHRCTIYLAWSRGATAMSRLFHYLKIMPRRCLLTCSLTVRLQRYR